MVWGSAALAAWETAAILADKPLAAPQVLPVSPDACKWIEDNIGAGFNISTNTDRSDADYPEYRGYDNYPGYVTKSDGVTVDNGWYYAINTGAGKEIEFDCAAVAGHNWDTLANGPITTAQLQIADDATFTTRLETIGSWTPRGADERLIDLALYHTGSVALRYSNVRFIRVYMNNGGGGNIIPEIGCLILGRRRQMEHQPLAPADRTSLHDTKARARTMGGIIHQTVYARRQYLLAANFREHEDTYVNNLISWFEDCSGAMIWIWQPNSAPNSWQFMLNETDDFDFPTSDWVERNVEIVATEQGPERLYLSQE